jgi:hypothetical protein
MMWPDGGEGQLQILEQSAGPEALIVRRDEFDDPDLVGIHHLLDGGLDLAISSPPSRPDTRTPVTPSGISGSSSIMLSFPDPVRDHASNQGRARRSAQSRVWLNHFRRFDVQRGSTLVAQDNIAGFRRDQPRPELSDARSVRNDPSE